MDCIIEDSSSLTTVYDGILHSIRTPELRSIMLVCSKITTNPPSHSPSIRMAQETMAESDRLRRLVANASSEAEKKAAQEEAAASELAMLERDVKSLESPEEGV